MTTICQSDHHSTILRETIRLGLPTPSTVPMENGGVQIEWATSTRVTSIEITDGTVFDLFDLDVSAASVTDMRTSNPADVLAFLAASARTAALAA